MRKVLCVTIFALLFFCGCESEKASIRCVRWTPGGVAFIRRDGLFMWEAEGAQHPFRVGEWELREERFALSPDGRRVALVSAGEVPWNIWEVDIPGGAGRRITDSIYKDFFPVYAPSGDSIFFLSYRGGRPDIWRVGLDDLVPERVTDDALEERRFAVSPDGASLLYTVVSEDGRHSLHSLSLPDGESRMVAEELTPVSSLSFSPSGGLYVFCSGGGLWLGEVGHEPSKVADADSAGWAAGREALYYCSGGDIWRYVPSGLFSGKRRLTRSRWMDAVPSVSPDGRRVAYATGPGKAPELLTVVGRSFSPRTRIWCPTDAKLIDDYYLADGRPGEAARYFSSILGESGERAELARLAASDLISAGRYRRALAVLTENTGDDYEIGKIYMYYLRDFAAAIGRLKGLEKAREELMLLYACKPALLKRYCRGWVEVQEGNYGKGLRLIDGFVKGSGKLKALEPVYYMRARLYDQGLRDTSKALAAYREALDGWPESDQAESARLRLGQLYEEAGELDEAIAAYNSAAESTGIENASEMAAAYASILRITAGRGGDIRPILRDVGAKSGPYRAEFVNEAQRILDEKGEYGEANGVIRTALFDWGLEPDDIAEGLFRSCAAVDAEDLVRVTPRGLPAWFKERVVIAVSRVHGDFGPPMKAFLENPAPEAAEKVLAAMEDSLGGLEPAAAADYVLGNLYLNEGDLPAAVSSFTKLCGREDGYYAQQLACCRRAARREALEWLKLERRYGFVFWGDGLHLVDVLAGRRGLFSEGGAADRPPDFTGDYRAFIERYPESLLVPACEARIASTLPESTRQRALLALLEEKRDGCVSLPFFLLMGEYAAAGNFGLALSVGEPLARSVPDPSIKLSVAELLGEVGGEREALPFLWDISINYTDSPEWEIAQQKLISSLISSGKYKSALLMLDELIEKRPSSEPVLSDEAQLSRIEILARLGRLREAATAACALISTGGDSLRGLPAAMTDDLAGFMFLENKDELLSLYSSVDREEREKLEEMVPQLKEASIMTKPETKIPMKVTRYKKQDTNKHQ